MTYVNILNEDTQVQCTKQGKFYLYDIKEDGTEFNIGKHEKSPLELSRQTTIGKQIFQRINDNLTAKQKRTADMDKEFRLIMEKLEKDINIQIKEAERAAKKEVEELEVEYEEHYAHFINQCHKHGFTPLQYIIRVFEGLGVDAHIEMFKSLNGFLQTFLGLKGTNVIGVGSQSSGKTHCIEKPLECIPEEFVHKGTFTRAYFFDMYSGQDLTGHIFYLGDLGGVHDDENTIVSRDILKQLTSDGWTSRGLKDDEDGGVKDIVTGYPAIAYTTVSEDIINEQERSRSVIIRPPDVDQRRLMVFDSFIESPGELWELQQTIEEDKKSITGFVWWLKKEIENSELFNPFMFCVQKYLANMPDFNRKIKEFNMLLKIICILNNSYSLTHKIYCDFTKDNVEDIEIVTKMYIPSKQDVIDALTLFEGSTGLLPSEIALTKGLLKIYSEFPYSDIPDGCYELTEDSSFEEIVQYNAISSSADDLQKPYSVMDLLLDEDTGKYYLDGYDDSIEGADGESIQCFFTIDNVKHAGANQRWYREVKDELSNKLYKLWSFGILIKVGQNLAGRNIYGIGKDVNEKVNNINPVFAKKDIDDAMKVFHEKYPTLSASFDEFVNNQKQLRIKKTNFEIKENHLYDLQWNHIKV